MTALGAFIRQRRAARHLSVRDLAKDAGLSPAFVSDIELGRRHPSEKALLNIALVLHVSANELRARDSRPPIDDIKRVASSDPMFSLALRTMLDKEISGHRLLEMLKHEKSR
jgi:transcriptional regulator with XRE-family HTH domain